MKSVMIELYRHTRQLVLHDMISDVRNTAQQLRVLHEVRRHKLFHVSYQDVVHLAEDRDGGLLPRIDDRGDVLLCNDERDMFR